MPLRCVNPDYRVRPPSGASGRALTPAPAPLSLPLSAMKRLVECVPNFSEGRDGETIDAIAEAIRHTPACTLLDVDPGRSTNRTVYTFVGDPGAAAEGGLAGPRVPAQGGALGRHH